MFHRPFEHNYDFRKRMLEVHNANVRDYDLLPQTNEVEVTEEWEIVIPENADRVILTAAKDLQDYFFTSMGLSLRLIRSNNIKVEAENGLQKIVFITKEATPELGESLDTPRSYRFIASENRIVLCGYDERGAAQAYLKSLKHQEASDAAEYYDGTYGKVLEKCPGLKGIVVVGESPKMEDKTG